MNRAVGSFQSPFFIAALALDFGVDFELREVGVAFLLVKAHAFTAQFDVRKPPQHPVIDCSHADSVTARYSRFIEKLSLKWLARVHTSKKVNNARRCVK